jgi:hypothetical protein
MNSARDEESFDSSPELSDVPAAVVCVHCLSADCMGCETEELRSGIVQIVPWEREGGLLGRLWNTSYLSSHEAAAFFAHLPDGPIGPALRFAMVAELASSAAMILFTSLGISAFAPHAVWGLLTEPGTRAWVIKLLVVGIPALATLLVGAHAAHGIWIDKGARKVGAPSSRSRALRFGLYACGWDIIIGPIGFFVMLLKKGPSAASEVITKATGLPTRATEAFLTGH